MAAPPVPTLAPTPAPTQAPVAVTVSALTPEDKTTLAKEIADNNFGGGAIAGWGLPQMLGLAADTDRDEGLRLANAAVQSFLRRAEGTGDLAVPFHNYQGVVVARLRHSVIREQWEKFRLMNGGASPDDDFVNTPQYKNSPLRGDADIQTMRSLMEREAKKDGSRFQKGAGEAMAIISKMEQDIANPRWRQKHALRGIFNVTPGAQDESSNAWITQDNLNKAFTETQKSLPSVGSALMSIFTGGAWGMIKNIGQTLLANVVSYSQPGIDLGVVGGRVVSDWWNNKSPNWTRAYNERKLEGMYLNALARVHTHPETGRQPEGEQLQSFYNKHLTPLLAEAQILMRQIQNSAANASGNQQPGVQIPELPTVQYPGGPSPSPTVQQAPVAGQAP